MKENLLQKLDLLEAQLAQSTNGEEAPKLTRTKYLLEKLAKSDQPKPDRQQLQTEILQTKQEIAKRKLHYASTIIKRFLKQFKKVEPLRIAKRLKAAESEEKQHTLKLEEDTVKQFDIEVWGPDVLNRYLVKKVDVQTVFGENLEKRQLSTTESNIYGRIGKSEVVRKAQTQLYESLLPLFPNCVISDSNSGSAGSTNSGSANEPDTSEASKSESVNSKEPNSNATASKRKSSDDFTEFEEEPRAESKSGEPTYDPFFEGNIELANSDSDSDNGSSLPALMQGYMSGSDSEDEVVDPKPVRRNRRGQRARQKIWEQKYGNKANHVLKQQQEEQAKAREKELKRRRKEEKYIQIKKQKQEFESKPVHPSWEAKQKLKQQQEKLKFQGKKVMF